MNAITEYSDFAGRRRRLAAMLLDGVFLCIIAWLFTPTPAEWVGWLLNGTYWITGNIVGVTPGKYYLRILIQTRDGQRPGLKRGLIRSVDYILPCALWMAGAPTGLVLTVFLIVQLGYFPILTHSERRSIYDQLSGTWVVRGRRQSTGPVTI